jgi:hypothetical protein
MAVVNDMAPVKAWSEERKIPVYVGEFGAYEKADMASRARWTAYCARLFERLGFSWSYWEFCSGFGVYDASTETWRDELVDALISDNTNNLKLGTPPQPKKRKGGKSGGGSLVKNGDFAKGLEEWTFGAWQGKANGEVGPEGIFKVVIIDPGSEGWNIQLLQPGILLQDGHAYAVTFDAWAEAPRLIGSGVENSENYASFGGMQVQLTKEKKTFVYQFTKQGGTDPKGRVSFSLGGEGGTVYIDNVKVEDLGK